MKEVVKVEEDYCGTNLQGGSNMVAKLWEDCERLDLP